MKYKVLVADKLSDTGVELLKKHCTVTVKPGMKESELIKEVSKYHAVIVRSATKITKKVIQAAKNLQIVARAGVGVDNIDIEAATQAGIIVVNSPTGNILAAAELAFGYLYALARNIPQANETMHQGQWNKKAYVGAQVSEKTLGVVGFGKIGQLVAKAAVGVGMNVLVYDPVITEDKASAVGGKLVTLNQLLKEADFITLHVPKSPRTYHLISDKEIAKMKKGVRIINCSRGGVIDEEALLKALKSGKVAGAALDVFEQEPPSADYELLSMPNVLMTPHLGASTAEAQVNVAVDVARQVINFFDGQFPTSAVNMPAINPEIIETHKPYFELASKIGALLAGLLNSTMSSISIRYEGGVANMETDLITRNLLVGLLKLRYDDVNIVNAPVMIKERGVTVSETSSDNRTRYVDLITVEVESKKGKRSVSGTLTIDRQPRIVDIDSYGFDLAPEGLFLLATHHDQPGMIGKVGTLLGTNDINIAGMQVGRKKVRGVAIMAINLDDEVPPELLKQIRKFKGIKTVSVISF